MENPKEISSNDQVILDPNCKLSIDGKQYHNIMSIAILCEAGEENLAEVLKKNHCQFTTPLDNTHSYIIFNKPARTIAQLAGRAGISSFIHCHGNTKELWRIKNQHFKYNSVKNPYIFSGSAEVALNITLLDRADKAIGNALDAVKAQFHLVGETNGHILDYVYNKTGMRAAAYRKIFTESLKAEFSDTHKP